MAILDRVELVKHGGKGSMFQTAEWADVAIAFLEGKVIPANISRAAGVSQGNLAHCMLQGLVFAYGAGLIKIVHDKK